MGHRGKNKVGHLKQKSKQETVPEASSSAVAKNAGHLNKKNKQETVPEASPSTDAGDEVSPVSFWRSFATLSDFSFGSKNKETLLQEEIKRRDENDKKLSSELQELVSCLKEVDPGIAFPNGDDPAAIVKASRDHLMESKNKQSSLSEKFMRLEGINRKNSEDLDTTKADLEWAKSRASAKEKKATKRLNKAKSMVEEANSRASTAAENLNMVLQQMKESQERASKNRQLLQNSKINLKDVEDKVLEWEKVIGDMNTAISDIEFPVKFGSMEISHKVVWLAEEHKKTCQDLKSTKGNLEKANFRADTAEKGLEETKLNLKQAKLEASSKLSVMELNFEQAKKELDECRTKLKAAELKVESLDKIERVISHIEFLTDTQPKDTLTKIERLSDHYNKNFINSMTSIIERNPEAAIGLLHRMEAKIADDLSETLRSLVQEADVEVPRVEDLDSGSSDVSHTELEQQIDDSERQNTGGAVATDQDTTHDVEQGSCSGGRTIVGDSVYSRTSGQLLYTSDESAGDVNEGPSNPQGGRGHGRGRGA